MIHLPLEVITFRRTCIDRVHSNLLQLVVLAIDRFVSRIIALECRMYLHKNR